jgi:hypothetical protein
VSPTTLSLDHLRRDGWLVDVCERWVPGAPGRSGSRRDLFGMLDLVALRDGVTLGVQTTSAANVSSRLTKMSDDEHDAARRALLDAGWLLVVHGWRKSTRDGHACKHGRTRCACRWTLHREVSIELT